METTLTVYRRTGIHPCRRGQPKGARWERISIALLSLSISLCPGNAKLWQGASLPPTASSCERGFPIQAIYMVFWPLCDQALANYLLPEGQNPGFSVQYWNQLAGKNPYCKDAVRKKWVFFFFVDFFMFMTCHSPVFYYFRYVVCYSFSYSPQSALSYKTSLDPEARRSCLSPCSNSTCFGGGVASVSSSLEQEFYCLWNVPGTLLDPCAKESLMMRNALLLWSKLRQKNEWASDVYKSGIWSLLSYF